MLSMTTSWFFAGVFYLVFAIFVVGFCYKIFDYWRTPAPLKIPTTPAPTTTIGVAGRLLGEVVFFQSLFKANLWIWGASMLFHVGLLLVVIRHLRYFLEPVPTWLVWLQPLGIYGAFAMVAGLALLWLRRFAVERIRYISTPSDHLWLFLLIMIGVSGLMMKFVVHTDIVAVKIFFLGLMQFEVHPLPSDTPLLVHLSLIAILLLLFPFSKLMHAPGLLFSPSRNQADNPRERRHLAKWAASLENQ